MRWHPVSGPTWRGCSGTRGRRVQAGAGKPLNRFPPSEQGGFLLPVYNHSHLSSATREPHRLKKTLPGPSTSGCCSGTGRPVLVGLSRLLVSRMGWLNRADPDLLAESSPPPPGARGVLPVPTWAASMWQLPPLDALPLPGIREVSRWRAARSLRLCNYAAAKWGKKALTSRRPELSPARAACPAGTAEHPSSPHTVTRPCTWGAAACMVWGPDFMGSCPSQEPHPTPVLPSCQGCLPS